MRIVTYGAACSLDGFIGQEGDTTYGWIRHSKDAQGIMRDYWGRIDTLVMGRKTWDVAARMGGGASGTVHSYVFSRTLNAIDRPRVTLVRDDPVTFVRDLKAGPGKEICLFGGGELAAPLFAAGLVDEVGVNVQPILLGGGIPLFRDIGKQVRLELKECRQLDGGCVYLLYRCQV